VTRTGWSALILVVALLLVLCWTHSGIVHYARGYEAGIASVRTPLIEDGRIRWVETDRDTLASGLVIYEVRDMVWGERCIVIVREGEPVYAVMLDPR
jgi:hypothetical protein